MEISWTIISLTFPKMVSRKAPSEHRIFASREKRLPSSSGECARLIRKRWDDGKFRRNWKGLTTFHSTSIASNILRIIVDERKLVSRAVPFPVAPTDCQDSIPVFPANFRSRARKHVSSRGRKEKSDNARMKLSSGKSALTEKSSPIRIRFFLEIQTRRDDSMSPNLTCKIISIFLCENKM